MSVKKYVALCLSSVLLFGAGRADADSGTAFLYGSLLRYTDPVLGPWLYVFPDDVFEGILNISMAGAAFQNPTPYAAVQRFFSTSSCSFNAPMIGPWTSYTLHGIEYSATANIIGTATCPGIAGNSNYGGVISRNRTVFCPAPYVLSQNQLQYYDEDGVYNGPAGTTPLYGSFPPLICILPVNNDRSCPFGDPIFPASGRQTEEQEDVRWTPNFDSLVRKYDSLTPASAEYFGGWETNYTKRLQIDSAQTVYSVRNGRAYAFQNLNGGRWVAINPSTSLAAADERDYIFQGMTSSGASTWVYVDVDAGAFEIYDGVGNLIGRQLSTGESVSIQFSNASTPATIAPGSGFPISVIDSFGRALNIQYGTDGHAIAVIDPSGNSITYSYNGPSSVQGSALSAVVNLTQITYQDNTQKVNWYNEPANTAQANYPRALTGVTDENGTRFSTFQYNAVGQAISTELAGGVDSFSYTGGGSISGVGLTTLSPQVQDPLGNSLSVSYARVNTTWLESGRSQPAGAGCGPSTQSFVYDQNGNVANSDDFSGNRTCSAYDLSRNLETSRVEGLANTVTCSGVLAAGAALPSPSRKTSTQWHPEWHLKVQRAEPGKLTTWVYNGQPDPFAGGTPASCAPATALLPDGNPIAVLCKQVEQATSDADGHSGFAAALQPGVSNRTRSWTYNQYGQVLTAKGPRTDIDDSTSYAYYSDTTAEHTMGDLAQVTNALHQVTSYSKYNPAGQLLEMIDANGVVTDNTYDLRQRLTSKTVGGLQTSYLYDSAGQLVQLSLPDATQITYSYDQAHRLTQVNDQFGNSVTYVLDNAGNRTQELVKDNTGTLSRTVTRVFDALGRLQQATGAPN